MKKLSFLSLLIFLPLSLLASETHRGSECPEVNGNYFTSNGQLRRISSHSVSDGRAYILYPGTRPILADGQIHNGDNGTKIIGFCENKRVKIYLKLNEQVLNRLDYEIINPMGDLRVTSVGAENFVEVFKKDRP